MQSKVRLISPESEFLPNMSQSSRERINEERRKIFTERVFGTPGERAAYWSTFVTDFWEQAFDRAWPYRYAGSAERPSMVWAGPMFMRDVDIVEEGDNLVVELDMPNYDKDKIHLKLADNFLYVSASRADPIDRAEVERVHVAARPTRFRRTIWLPARIEQDAKVSAKYADGVLRVTIPLKSSTSIPIE
jgi:HSP20 family molecular chaperone IbpA